MSKQLFLVLTLAIAAAQASFIYVLRVDVNALCVQGKDQKTRDPYRAI